jgi:chorismate dehydratase
MAHKKEAIESVLPYKPFTYEQLDAYLGPTIRWDLTEDYLDGLKTFYTLAHQMNLIEHIPEIKLANVRR